MSNLLFPTGSSVGGELAVDSHIVGAFTGWRGRTLFKLRNGQLWQQEGYGHRYRYSFMPRVLITRSGDRYDMLVEGVDIPVPVRRLC